MQVHTFRAESLQAALQQVRQSLGPDASIVHTREKRRSRFGLFSQTVIEVEATVDLSVNSQLDNSHRPSPRTEMQNRVEHPSLPSSATPQAVSQVSSAVGAVAKKSPSLDNQPPSTPSPGMLEVQSDLLTSGVTQRLASTLLMEADGSLDAAQRDDVWAIRGRVGQLVAAKLKVSGSIDLKDVDRAGPMVVALVGPTGVGKTTTLAKIAAGFRFDLGCRVGLITMDTFRLGAVDQLLQYAELISASLEVVSSPEQVAQAIERLSECDLVLLDTAGRAPRDAEQIAELRRFLGIARPQATHLVVSATSSTAYVEETLRNFSQLNPSNLLITKLDEAVAFGSWLQLLHNCPLPISYLTTGQHVPQDIAVASSRRITSLLLGTNHPVSLPPKTQVASLN
jgi:flagellar biosynthesis protein FlhF